jgi:hypothetical protein
MTYIDILNCCTRIPRARDWLAEFDGSLPKALEDAYPGHVFYPWIFPKVQPKFWDDKQVQVQFMKWVMESLQLRSLDDFYKIPPDTIKELGGSSSQPSIA